MEVEGAIKLVDADYVLALYLAGMKDGSMVDRHLMCGPALPDLPA
jgi:hypothetical protein